MKIFIISFVTFFSLTTWTKDFVVNEYKVSVEAPSGFKVSKSKDKVVVKRKGLARFKETVEISVYKDEIPKELKTNVIGSRTIHYSVAPASGGSRGTQFTVLAYEQINDEVIHYKHDSQNKGSSPELAKLWEVIEKTQVTK